MKLELPNIEVFIRELKDRKIKEVRIVSHRDIKESKNRYGIFRKKMIMHWKSILSALGKDGVIIVYDHYIGNNSLGNEDMMKLKTLQAEKWLKNTIESRGLDVKSGLFKDE